MATEVVHTVGSGGDYSTLAAWESAQNRNLVSADEIAVAEIIGGTNVGNPTNRIDFAGWTTDETRYILVRAQSGSEYSGKGEIDTSKAYIAAEIGGNNGALFPRHNFKIKNIQVDISGASGSAGAKCLFMFGGGGGVDIDSCIFKFTAPSGSASNQDGCIFELRSPSYDCHFRNNIFLIDGNSTTAGTTPCYIQSVNSGPSTHYFYNNTIITFNKTTGNTNSISIRNGEDAVTQNNYFHKPSGTSANHYNSSVGSSIVKGSNDATSNSEAATSGLQNIPYDSTTFESVASGSLDLTPKASGDIINAGADLSSSGITQDLIRRSRPQGDSFDIGALEALVTITSGVVEEEFSPNYEKTTMGKRVLTTSGGFLKTSSDLSLAPYVMAYGYTGHPLCSNASGDMLIRRGGQENFDQTITNTISSPDPIDFSNGNIVKINNNTDSSVTYSFESMEFGKEYKLEIHQTGTLNGSISFSGVSFPGGTNPHSSIPSGQINVSYLYKSDTNDDIYMITETNFS